jgi:GTP pyrophosphokinase
MKENSNELIKKARHFAMKKHKGQKDDSGKDYFEAHIEVVAGILSIVTEDSHIISAAYLHDVLEDTSTTIEELKNVFGEKIMNLVLEVTQEGQKDSHGYYFPRLKSKEGIMIKFADRLSNISRIDTWPEKRRNQYLRTSRFWRNE